MIKQRSYLMKRRCFEVLQEWLVRCQSYRALQLERNRRNLQLTYDAWHAYLRWCRRFNRIIKSVNRRRVQLALDAWAVFERTVRDRRNFLKNTKRRRAVEVLRHLHYNVLINRFALGLRLRTNSRRSFKDSFMRRYCFQQWQRRVAWRDM